MNCIVSIGTRNANNYLSNIRLCIWCIYVCISNSKNWSIMHYSILSINDIDINYWLQWCAHNVLMYYNNDCEGDYTLLTKKIIPCFNVRICYVWRTITRYNITHKKSNITITSRLIVELSIILCGTYPELEYSRSAVCLFCRHDTYIIKM